MNTPLSPGRRLVYLLHRVKAESYYEIRQGNVNVVDFKRVTARHQSDYFVQVQENFHACYWVSAIYFTQEEAELSIAMWECIRYDR